MVETALEAGQLFPEPTSPRLGPMMRTEPAVNWMTQSTRDEASSSRRLINEWYAEFPDIDRSFGARLRSDVDVDHYQATDELFVHHLLCQHGDDIRYEENGRGPDFTIYSGSRAIAAVEVASLFLRQAWTDEQRRFAILADGLDDRIRPTHGYFVQIEPTSLNRQPSMRKLEEFVREVLDRLPDPDVAPLPLPSDLRRATFVDDGVHIELRFLPMKPGAKSRYSQDARITGMGPVIGGFVNSAHRLRDRLRSKAPRRYDIADVPFLIAVAIRDPFCSDDQVLEALYGGEAVELPSGRLTRRRDGFFDIDPAPRPAVNTRVSVVAAFSWVPWRQEDASIAIYENPAAAVPWPLDFKCRRFGLSQDENGLKLDWLS